MSLLSRYGEKIINPSYYGKIIIDYKTGQINLQYPYSDPFKYELNPLEKLGILDLNQKITQLSLDLGGYNYNVNHNPILAQVFLNSAIEQKKKDILKKYCI